LPHGPFFQPSPRAGPHRPHDGGHRNFRLACRVTPRFQSARAARTPP
jgi:hypothetical protein